MAAVLIALILVTAAAFYFYVAKILNYWKDRHVPCDGTKNVLLDHWNTITQSKSFVDIDNQLYERLKHHKFVGSFEFLQPVMWIMDPELIKRVYVKDFHHFVDRKPFIMDPALPYFNQMLGMLKGQEWKDVRSVISPTFTSGKLKHMLSTVSDCCNGLIEYFSEMDGTPLEMKESYGRCVMDIVASVAFGLECNCFKHPDTPFPKMAGKFLNPGKARTLSTSLHFLFPRLMQFLRVPTLSAEPLHYFAKVIQETVEHREKSGTRGKDYLQLLLDTKKDELEQQGNRKASSKVELTDSLVIAQAILFFVAGYEAVATVLSFVSYDLALNPTVQEKLHTEIETVLEKHGGQLSYEALQDMHYVDTVFDESLRLHTPGIRIERICTKDYIIPESNVTIPKGMPVFIAAMSIHMDEKYFPKAKEFAPEENFSPEQISERHPYIYMPFGHGPRNCVGMRFGQLQTKIVLVNILRRFRLVPCEKTQIPIKYTSGINILRAQKGVWLKAERR